MRGDLTRQPEAESTRAPYLRARLSGTTRIFGSDSRRAGILDAAGPWSVVAYLAGTASAAGSAACGAGEGSSRTQRLTEGILARSQRPA